MVYLGGKEKIVNDLLKFIPYSDVFIDLCTGSGIVGVSYKRKYNNRLVIHNDIVGEQVDLLEYILSLDKPLSETFLFDLWISRQDFKDIRDGKENEYTKKYKWFRRFVLQNWSFGNNLKGYMYGKNIEARKKAIHDTVLKIKYNKEWDNDMYINSETVYNSMTDIGKLFITKEEFTKRLKELYNNELNNKNRNNYAIKNIYARILQGINIPKLDKKQLRDKKFKKQYMENVHKLAGQKELAQFEGIRQLQSLERLERLESLERLERLQSLQSLERLERLQSLESLESLERLQSLQSLETKLEFTSLSIFEFDFSKYRIEDTIVYIDPPYEDTHGYGTPDIDYDYFREWFNNHPYKMIASSYKARDYIKCVAVFDKRKTISGNSLAKEGLFVNKSFTKQSQSL